MFAALEKHDDAERRAFLDEACAGDARPRQRVERLLAADKRDRGILDHTVHCPPHVEAFTPGPSLAAAQVFARRFALGRKFGEGGMGEVWAADQQEPVWLRVALKVIRPRFASARATSRFEQERQALALMSAPISLPPITADPLPQLEQRYATAIWRLIGSLEKTCPRRVKGSAGRAVRSVGRF